MQYIDVTPDGQMGEQTNRRTTIYTLALPARVIHRAGNITCTKCLSNWQKRTINSVCYKTHTTAYNNQ